MKFKHWFAFAFLVAGLTQGGCSFLMPSTEMISLSIKPEDAIIILNGTRFEGVPFFAPVAKSDDLLITVYRAKMPTRHYVVRRKLSTTGILDCVGSIAILPAFGLLTGGAWELEENNIMIDLNELRTNVTEINSIEQYEDADQDQKPVPPAKSEPAPVAATPAPATAPATPAPATAPAAPAPVPEVAPAVVQEAVPAPPVTVTESVSVTEVAEPVPPVAETSEVKAAAPEAPVAEAPTVEMVEEAIQEEQETR